MQKGNASVRWSNSIKGKTGEGRALIVVTYVYYSLVQQKILFFRKEDFFYCILIGDVVYLSQTSE